MSTEAGDAAADASIQALGGYGYTHEYMVEKISRDVRITRIYEGTSEIMEMTISRDRWQLHLKTRGQHYHDRAREVGSCCTRPSQRRRRCRCAGLARVGRSDGEGARQSPHSLSAHPAAHGRVDCLCRMRCQLGPPRRACRRRPTARKSQRALRCDGVGGDQPHLRARSSNEGGTGRLARRHGAGGVSDAEMPAFETALHLSAIHRAQAGLIADMDYVADVLYGRASKTTPQELKEAVLSR